MDDVTGGALRAWAELSGVSPAAVALGAELEAWLAKVRLLGGSRDDATAWLQNNIGRHWTYEEAMTSYIEALRQGTATTSEVHHHGRPHTHDRLPSGRLGPARYL